VFNRHADRTALDGARKLIVSKGLARTETIRTSGRPTVRMYVVAKEEKEMSREKKALTNGSAKDAN
jgi:hypothetical protein